MRRSVARGRLRQFLGTRHWSVMLANDSEEEEKLAADDLPLAGIRVLDFTQILAGPYCTQMLADAGADVIKVEPPSGEFSRIRGPQRLGSDGITTLSAYSAIVNRGKRSLVLDLKNEKGLDLAQKLVATSDIVIENYAVGTMDRLGMNLQRLREMHPSLITVSITLWGVDADDELARHGGLAPTAEAESAMLGLIRDGAGVPVRQSVPLGDLVTGLASYGAITTALLARGVSGVGRHINMSMVKTMLSLNSLAISSAQIPESGTGSGFRATAALGVFPTTNGFVCIGVNSDSLWKRFSDCMSRPELAVDPRYEHYPQRDSRVDEVNAIVAEWTSQFSSEELVALISPSGVPIGIVREPEDILEVPTFRRLRYLETVDDGIGGTIQAPGNPMGWSRADYQIPRLGQHSEDCLRERLGLSHEEYLNLQSAGAFGSNR
jgi:CoA:oxalate CoA-transferase